MSYVNAHTESHPGGIYTIDTGFTRAQMTASHLIVDNGRAAFADVATSLTIPRLVEALKDLNIAFDQIDYILLTHIHLDHAGAAGNLMKLFPNAKCVVHPRGARHMIDPSVLIAGATKVFGEAMMRKNYGPILPIDAKRIIEIGDKKTLKLGARKLTFYDTPGHAKHHYCIHDKTTDSIFTGDTFGLCYPQLNNELEFVFPTTTPVHFDPEAMHNSIKQLVNLKPKQAFLTHYGKITQLESAAEQLHRFIDQFTTMTKNHRGDYQTLVQDMLHTLTDACIEKGCLLSAKRIRDLLRYDTEINAQGLAYWYHKN